MILSACLGISYTAAALVKFRFQSSVGTLLRKFTFCIHIFWPSLNQPKHLYICMYLVD